ncbi:hypothetical protein RRG08_041782 [Elysia crispata]|uniref:Uncharacterized protein n=1 Tax=Elysia crispata TaxID=231223 RepID=A0AAE1B8A3_9GAST|nr:hypothetical protein RRG08_041782 [Elysia crispata]
MDNALQFYVRENSVTQEALDAIEELPRTVWKASTFAVYEEFSESSGRIGSSISLEKGNFPATCAVVRSRPQDGRWAQHTQTHHCLVNKLLDVTKPSSSSVFQGRLQAKHEIDRHQLKHLEIAHCRPQWLEICVNCHRDELLNGSQGEEELL